MDFDRAWITQLSDEALEGQIASARVSLRHDVILLQDKVSPSAVLDRRIEDVENRIRGWRSAVTRRWDSVTDTGSNIQSTMGATMKQEIDSAKESVRSRALVYAGLAFAAGLGVSRLIPMSRPEERMARKVAPVVGEKAGPLVDRAKTAVAQGAVETVVQRGM